jgi:quinol monooxygenase YgiN
VPIIVSTIKANDRDGGEVERLIAEAIPAIHRLPGCRRYALHRVRGRSHPGEFVLIEAWETDADLAAYGESPVLVRLHDDLEPLIHSLTDYLVADAAPYGEPEVGGL